MIIKLKYYITNKRKVVRVVKGFVWKYKKYDGRWTILKKKKGRQGSSWENWWDQALRTFTAMEINVVLQAIKMTWHPLIMVYREINDGNICACMRVCVHVCVYELVCACTTLFLVSRLKWFACVCEVLSS
jgi:hypothetical protein